MAPSLCSRQRQLGRAITVSSRFLQRKYTLTVLLQIVNMKEKAVKDRSHFFKKACLCNLQKRLLCFLSVKCDRCILLDCNDYGDDDDNLFVHYFYTTQEENTGGFLAN